MRESVLSAKSSPNLTRSATARYARYVFLVMFSINLLNYLDRYFFVASANRVAKELHFGLDGVGYLTSAFLIVYTLGTFPLGIWADRARRKNIIALCVTVWSLATMATATANSFFTLFISRMLLGIGEAGYFPAGTALLSDYFSLARRAKVMSWWSTGQYVGLMIGFVVGGVVTSAAFPAAAWRIGAIAIGLPGLLLALLAWRLREPRHNQADEEEALAFDIHASTTATDVAKWPHAVPSGMLSQLGVLMRNRTLVVLIVMQIFAFFVLGVNASFLPIYLQQKDTFGLDAGFAGIYAGGIIVVAGIIGIVGGGYMADILNRRYPGARVLVCGIGFLLSAPSFYLAITTRNFVAFSIFFVLTTILISIYNGPSTAATQDVVPSALRASAVAVSLLLAHMLGDAAAPAIVGVLATNFDPTHGQHFALGLAGQDLSGALLLTCVPALFVAGLVGIFGARWMKDDLLVAQQADRLAS